MVTICLSNLIAYKLEMMNTLSLNKFVVFIIQLNHLKKMVNGGRRTKVCRNCNLLLHYDDIAAHIPEDDDKIEIIVAVPSPLEFPDGGPHDLKSFSKIAEVIWRHR